MVKKIFANCYIYIILLLMYLPILVLIAFSFTEATNVGVWTGFSMNLYKALFTSREIGEALGNTVIIAVVSAVVSTVLGTLGAIGTFYANKKLRKTTEFVTQIPVVNAEIVMAMSLTVMFVFLGTYIFRNSIFNFFTLLVGHCCLSLPFVYLSVKPKLMQMDPNLYEAALDLGSTPRQALYKVIVPSVVPGILSGFMLSITLSLDDFVMTAFLRGPGLLSGDRAIETLSTLVQSKIKKGPIPPEMRALTTIIFLVVLVVAVVYSILSYRKAKINSVKKRKGRLVK